MQTYPRWRPYMRFLFVRPEFCPLGDLSTPNIRLSSDSTSRWTPLPLAKSSRYRATSGLSPYRTCAHRAHIIGSALAARTVRAIFACRKKLQFLEMPDIITEDSAPQGVGCRALSTGWMGGCRRAKGDPAIRQPQPPEPDVFYSCVFARKT